jgi:cellulose synthase/poly-beta-1,6-N-acetylglucosamine synthase-like glycosyltransferase
MEKPMVSIVIPCKEVNGYVRQCLGHCLGLDYGNFDIILLPDSGIREGFPRTRVIPTGPVKPSVKRNLGIRRARGRFIALIDSDAYPRKDWLSRALENLEGDAGIVGGPNLSPPGDCRMRKASNDILSSRIAAGSFSARYSGRARRDVEELPSCNIVFRRDIFMRVGGFDTSLLTAEDAKFCFQVRELGKRVVYSPDVVVYHHRRPLFRPHLRQMWVYGRDKARILGGFFSRKRLVYLAPSVFVLFLLLGFAVSFNPWTEIPLARTLYLGLIALYVLIVAAASIAKSPGRSYLIFPGIMLTHITYGLGFLYGLVRER